MEVHVVENFINGEFVAASQHIDSLDPSVGAVWAKIPDSGTEEVDKAVKAAATAFNSWSNTSSLERSKIMMSIADLLEAQMEEIAEIESRDQGKPVSLARSVDIPRAVYNFRFFATSILHQVHRSTVQDHFGVMNYEHVVPVGVAGLISPWNLPLYLLTFKIAPAIAVGNTVVCKPSEMTSVSAWKLCSILNKSGLPAGVVNMVFGTGFKAGNAIVGHPGVSLVSFTGSVPTAEKIRITSAPFSRKLSLELGGKNPAVIFGDVDLEKCMPGIVRSCYANQGEICLCTSRIFVQKSIYEVFVKKIVEEARKIRVGDPREPTTQMGALVSKEHLAKVTGFVETARKEGASILCGHGVEPLELPAGIKDGYYMRPTVITDVKDHSTLMQDEIFGPVICIVPFDTEEEVIQRANNVKYGLSATVWGENVAQIHRVAQNLQAGSIWCNCWMVRDLNMPFGGMKGSGIGREGFSDSLEFFTESKNICVNFT